MSQIFSQSKRYRNLTIFDVCSYSESQAHELFCICRWGSLDTVVCPDCGAVGRHYPKKKRRQWRCKECHTIFTVTTGTILADRKLPFHTLAVAIYLFAAAPKSEAANRAHPMLGITLRAAYTLFNKLREALWEQRDTEPLSGEVHIDGGHFCGKPRRPRKRRGMTPSMVNSTLRNRKANLVPIKTGTMIEPWNAEKLLNRRIVLVMREVSSQRRVGATKSRVVVVKAETAKNVLSPIKANVLPGTAVMTDQSSAYARLGIWFHHETVNHSQEYARDDGVNQNQAESLIGRLRRSEYGVLHGMRCQYFAFYAQEMAWREDIRHKTLGEKYIALITATMRTGHSKAFRGYNQGHRLPKEQDGLPPSSD